MAGVSDRDCPVSGDTHDAYRSWFEEVENVCTTAVVEKRSDIMKKSYEYLEARYTEIKLLMDRLSGDRVGTTHQYPTRKQLNDSSYLDRSSPGVSNVAALSQNIPDTGNNGVWRQQNDKSETKVVTKFTKSYFYC
ncbi:uncharacterized protein LOC129602541 [Paramacrobiotus metropolitanus]|uniref:uncharacterized protein LOC129602541 n=1 Tax=Paramacrobiotus metropolitanus TaxID=2943436 RepID=UPI002445E0F8|nr:uncharacterized protein LOC129602541 [Paramacrobiotus metropolitanus]